MTFSIDQAIVAANEWTSIAEPIVKAIFQIEDGRYHLSSAWLAAGREDQRAYDEAKRYVDKALDGLRGMLEGIRDNARCDYAKSGENGMTDAQWDAVEEFNAALDRGMVSVADFVRKMEDEA